MFRHVTLGLSPNCHTKCVECGGTMKPTGNSKTARSSRPAFNRYVSPSMWLVEYKCESCAEEEWCEAGMVEDLFEEGV